MRIGYIALMIILLSSVVSALNFTTTLTPVVVNSSSTYMFNLTFNNTYNESNVTKVSLTLPSFLTYLGNTNVSSLSSTFTNTSNNLSWTANFTNQTVEWLTFNASVFSPNATGNITIWADYVGFIENTNTTVNVTNYTVVQTELAPFEFTLSPSSVNSSYNYTFVLAFNNTNEKNVTELNLTLPSFLRYISNTNSSTAPSTFTNTSNILRWAGNFSNQSLINFTFNVSANSTSNSSGNITITANYTQQVQTKNSSVSVTAPASTPQTTMRLIRPTNSSVMPVRNVTVECAGNDTIGLANMSLFFTGNQSADPVLNLTTNWTASNGEINMTRNYTFTNLSDGRYLWNCRGTTTDGRSFTAAFNSVFYVDTSAPAITFAEPTPDNNDSRSNTTFNVSFTSTKSLSSARFTFGNSTRVVHMANLTVSGTAGSYMFNPNGTINLSDGYYEYVIIANDSLNNTNSTKRGIFIDRKKPTVSVSLPNTVSANSAFNATCTGSDAIDKSLAFNYYVTKMGTNGTNETVYNGSFGGNRSTISIPAEHQVPGQFNFLCTANDDAGNSESASKSYTVSAVSGSSSQQTSDNTNKNEKEENKSSTTSQRTSTGGSRTTGTTNTATDQDESSGSGFVFLMIFFLLLAGAIGGTLWYLNKKGVFVVMSIPERKGSP